MEYDYTMPEILEMKIRENQEKLKELKDVVALNEEGKVTIDLERKALVDENMKLIDKWVSLVSLSNSAIIAEDKQKLEREKFEWEQKKFDWEQRRSAIEYDDRRYDQNAKNYNESAQNSARNKIELFTKGIGPLLAAGIGAYVYTTSLDKSLEYEEHGRVTSSGGKSLLNKMTDLLPKVKW